MAMADFGVIDRWWWWWWGLEESLFSPLMERRMA